MKVSVLGATGYAGAELLRILYSHPEAEVVHIYHRRAIRESPLHRSTRICEACTT